MAKHQGKVYLGYEEETVGEKSQTLLNYTVNKIGGFPVSWSMFLIFLIRLRILRLKYFHIYRIGRRSRMFNFLPSVNYAECTDF